MKTTGARKHAEAARLRNPPSEAKALANSVRQLAPKLNSAAAFLLGMLIVYGLLKPHDATSVFAGDALPQNLLSLLIAMLVAATVAMRGWGTHASRLPVIIAIAGLTWLICVTTLAGRENNPRVAWHGFWQVISIAAIYFAGRGILTTAKSRAAIITILIAGGGALAVHGLHQINFSFPAQRAAYLVDPETTLRQADIHDAPAGSAARKRFEDRLLNSKEPLATFALANSLATLLSSSLVLIVGCGLYGWRKRCATPMQKATLCVGGAMIFATWFLTLSRTAYVAIVFTIIYAVLLAFLQDRSTSTKRLAVRALAATAIVSLGCLMWLLSNDRLVLSESLYSLRFRFEYWSGCIHMLSDHWLFGIGLGNFQAYYPTYKLETASETIADPHNWFFDIAVTLTLPIAVITLGWLASCLLPWSTKPNEVASVEANLDSGKKNLSLHRPLFFGAAIGGGMATFGLLLMSNVDIAVLLFAWPWGLFLAWTLWPLAQLIAQENFGLIRASAVSITICLLASGSWQATGIAMPLVLLLATAQTYQIVTKRTSARYLPIGLASAGLVVFLFQSWLPVTRAWRENERIAQARSTNEQLTFCENLRDADPLDVRAWSLQGQIYTGLALQAPANFPTASRAAKTAFDTWLEQDGTSFANWELATINLLEAASAGMRFGQDPSPCIDAADHYASQAVLRYPSSVALQVQAAVTAYLAGNTQRALLLVDEAQRLSDATPHDDKMLNMQDVYAPANLFGSLPAIATRQMDSPLPASGRANAELVAELLRTIGNADGASPDDSR